MTPVGAEGECTTFHLRVEGELAPLRFAEPRRIRYPLKTFPPSANSHLHLRMPVFCPPPHFPVDFNALIDFPAFARLHNATVKNASLLLRNTTGGTVLTLPPHATFDLRVPAMRKVFVADASYVIGSGAFDGVFIDRANFAARAVLELKNQTTAKGLAAHGWDLATAESLVAAQTRLLQELSSVLGPDRLVLAKETGGGAPFDDWKAANAMMTTDTFCSSYMPADAGDSLPNLPPPKCGMWSAPARGHSPGPIAATLAARTFRACQNMCCGAAGCEAVLYNTQIDRCQLLNRSYTPKFVCLNGTGVEWLSNKAAPGATGCSNGTHAAPVWDPAQCHDDMTTVMQAAARDQLTESHGQGPLRNGTQRMFTMACFLITAGKFSYFSYASWEKSLAWNLAGTEWWPEYDLPLGAPLDPPMTPDGDVPWRFIRRFASGTVVEVDLIRHSASIKWGAHPRAVQTAKHK